MLNNREFSPIVDAETENFLLAQLVFKLPLRRATAATDRAQGDSDSA